MDYDNIWNVFYRYPKPNFNGRCAETDPEFWNKGGESVEVRSGEGTRPSHPRKVVKILCRSNAFCAKFLLGDKMHPGNRGGAAATSLLGFKKGWPPLLFESATDYMCIGYIMYVHTVNFNLECLTFIYEIIY